MKSNMLKKEVAGANVSLIGHKCYRCSHEWLPQEKGFIPTVCPKCKSPYWNKPKVRFNKGANKNERNK